MVPQSLICPPLQISSHSQMLLAKQSSPYGSEAVPTSSDYPPEPLFTTFTLQTNQTPSWTPPPPNHHSPLPCTPPFYLIRSSSVARHHGLFLHSTDTWQTNECSFVWRDPPQIAPKMHHTGICLFFCIFNVCMCVSRLSVLFCSVLVKRNKGTSSLPSAAYEWMRTDCQWQGASMERLKEYLRQTNRQTEWQQWSDELPLHFTAMQDRIKPSHLYPSYPLTPINL